jgi:hypothetical protein
MASRVGVLSRKREEAKLIAATMIADDSSLDVSTKDKYRHLHDRLTN